MGKFFSKPLGDLTATGAGSAVDVSHLEEVSFLVGGTFVGTYDVEVSFDGSVWVPHPDHNGETAPKAGDVAIPIKQVRINCTAFTSGTLECHVSGRDNS